MRFALIRQAFRLRYTVNLGAAHRHCVLSGQGRGRGKPVCIGYSLLESIRGKEWGQLAWGMPVFRDLEQPKAGLADRMGGLKAELEWAHVLSLGEQQRIAILRLLLHCPALAFLDEVPFPLCGSPGFPCLLRLVARS